MLGLAGDVHGDEMLSPMPLALSNLSAVPVLGFEGVFLLAARSISTFWLSYHPTE